jgi:hypothetical protein
MKVVKFVKPLDGYRVDDCASFEDVVADRVIAAGYGAEIKLEDTKAADQNAKK